MFQDNAPDSSPDDTHCYLPLLSFNETPLLLRDLIKQHTLPRVIKCDEGSRLSRDCQGLNIDLTQPLLAYQKWSGRKVAAHSLVYDSNVGEFVSVGNGILIPEGYPGWFAVLDAPGEVAKIDVVVPHFSKLSSLAASMCTQFLLGGLNSLPAAMIQRGHGNQTNTLPCTILPGTVLRKAGLCQVEQPQKTTRGSKKKKGSEPQTPQYLRCFDEHDRELFINTQQAGIFYILEQEGSPVSRPILQIGEIIQRYRFPLMVQQVYGRVPDTPCSFTQTLLLADSGLSQSVIASPLACSSNTVLEIPLGTDMKFYFAECRSGLGESKMFNSEIQACREKYLCFVKEMKIIFGSSHVEDFDLEITQLKKLHRSSASSKAAPTQSAKDPHNQPDVIEETADDVLPGPHLPKLPLSILSKTSYLSQMSARIAFHDHSVDVSYLVLPATPPLTRSDGVIKKSSLRKSDIDLNAKLIEVKTFEIPETEVIRSSKRPGRWSSASYTDSLDSKGDCIADHEYEYPNLTKSTCSDIQKNSPSVTAEKDSPMPEKPETTMKVVPSCLPTSPRSSSTRPVLVSTEDHVYEIPNEVANKPSTCAKPRPEVPPNSCKQTTQTTQSKTVDQDAQLYLQETELEESTDLKKVYKQVVCDSVCERGGQLKDSSSQTSIDSQRDSLEIDSKHIHRVQTPIKQVSCRPDPHPPCDVIYRKVPRPHLWHHENSSNRPFAMYHHENQQPPIVKDLEEDNCYDKLFENGNHDSNNGYVSPIHVEYPNCGQFGSVDEDGDNSSEYSRLDYNLVEEDITNKSRAIQKTLSCMPKATKMPKRSGSEPANNGKVAIAIVSQMPHLIDICGLTHKVPAENSPPEDDTTARPPLPRRPKQPPPPIPKKKTLVGQFSERPPPTRAFTQINKDMLIAELVKAGITKTAELGLRSLQLGDLTVLLNKESSFDDELVALLPKVGSLDLRNIAKCFNNLKLSM